MAADSGFVQEQLEEERLVHSILDLFEFYNDNDSSIALKLIDERIPTDTLLAESQIMILGTCILEGRLEGAPVYQEWIECRFCGAGEPSDGGRRDAGPSSRGRSAARVGIREDRRTSSPAGLPPGPFPR